MLNYFDKFLAVDFFVLNQLNISYPKFRHKFVSLTAQFRDTDIFDPYKLQSDEYKKVMNDIRFVSENINLNDL